MNILRTAIALTAMMLATQAYAAEEQYVMSCDEVVTKLHREATEAAKARFGDLEGACMGVVERDNKLYMHTKIVVRRVRGSTITIYVPATDRTFDVEVPANARVVVQKQRIRARDLSRGQQLNVYVGVDQLTQPIIQQVHFETETPESSLSPAPAVMAPALPTTG